VQAPGPLLAAPALDALYNLLQANSGPLRSRYIVYAANEASQDQPDALAAAGTTLLGQPNTFVLSVGVGTPFFNSTFTRMTLGPFSSLTQTLPNYGFFTNQQVVVGVYSATCVAPATTATTTAPTGSTTTTAYVPGSPCAGCDYRASGPLCQGFVDFLSCPLVPSYRVIRNSTATSLNNPSLTLASEAVVIGRNSVLEEIVLPALTVSERLDFYDHKALTRLELPVLTRMNGCFVFEESYVFSTTLELPSLRSLGCNIVIVNNTLLPRVIFEKLESLDLGSVTVIDNKALTFLSMPRLTFVARLEICSNAPSFVIPLESLGTAPAGGLVTNGVLTGQPFCNLQNGSDACVESICL
jgi:hypothetical protein